MGLQAFPPLILALLPIAASAGGFAAHTCVMGRTLLTVAWLLISPSAAAGNGTYVVLYDGDASLTLQQDPPYVAFVRMSTAVAIILGGAILFRELTLGIFDKMATKDEEEDEEEEEEGDDDEEKEENNEEKEEEEEGDDNEQLYSSYTHYDRKDSYYNWPYFHSYHNHPTSYRSLTDNECFLARVFSSIDLLESAFAVLQEEELSCRRRTLCELQKAVSRIPILGSLLQYFSRCVRGLEVYKEAIDAGIGLEDCALLFSECSGTELQANEPPPTPARPT